MGNAFSLMKHGFIRINFLLFTDASGVHGYGAVFEKSWFYGSWNEEWLSYNITVPKLYPIVLAVGLWRERLANRSVCSQCDNEALALMLNKKSSKEKNVMYFLRKLVFLSLKFNILFKAEHIPGKRNVLSDALSSLQINRFQRLLPDAEVEPTLIPVLSVLPC